VGLTAQSSGVGVLREDYLQETAGTEGGLVVALAGNPNTGKSTVFNALTGLNQHTGNWPGKTVIQTRGQYQHGEEKITVVDLPGTYSVLANSPEEQIARDFICFGRPDATVVVVDATSLERNLNLVLQVVEITPRVILCLNLMDEARRKGIDIDVPGLADRLGIPVIPTVARDEKGLDELKNVVKQVAQGTPVPRPAQVTYSDEIEEQVAQLEPELRRLLRETPFNPRWVALRLLEGDETIANRIGAFLTDQGEVAASRSTAGCPGAARGSCRVVADCPVAADSNCGTVAGSLDGADSNCKVVASE